MSTKLVFTSFMRPEYLMETLDSWNNARGIRNIEKQLFLDPSPAQEGMKAVAAQSMPDLEVTVNDHRKGVLTNPWNAIDTAFEDPEVDFVILGEEDLIVSSDILEYFQWAKAAYSPEEALGVCCYTAAQEGSEAHTELGPDFGVWIWGTWRESWFDHIRVTWDHDYSTNNGRPGVDAGWDHNLNRLAKTVKPFVHSAVSRSKHIGEHNGSHMTPSLFATMLCPTFKLDRDPVAYVRI